MLNCDRFIVPRTGIATRSMSNFFSHSEKRQHNTNYRQHAHNIGRDNFNMSAIFVSRLKLAREFITVLNSRSCLFSAGDLKSHILDMTRFGFLSYTTSYEVYEF